MKLVTENELVQRAKHKDGAALGQLRQYGYFERKKSQIDGWPMVSGQEQLWRLHSRPYAKHSYHLSFFHGISASAKLAQLEQALQDLVERQSILRSVFFEDGGHARQKPLSIDEIQLNIEFWDKKLLTREEIEEKTKEFYEKPFNLSQAPLFRLAMSRDELGKQNVHWCLHHIIADAWSFNLLEKEFLALLEGRPLPPLNVQYYDYATWLNARLQSEKEIHQAYWDGQIKGKSSRLNLPTTRLRPRLFNGKGLLFKQILSPKISNELIRVADERAVSPFQLIIALFSLMLFELCGKDPVFGIVINTRQNRKTQDLIGYLINTLAFGVDISKTNNLGEILESVKLKMLELWEHVEFPFQQQIQLFNQAEDPSLSPGVDVLFSFHDLREGSSKMNTVSAEDLPKAPSTIEDVPAKADLTFECVLSEEGIKTSLTAYAEVCSPDLLKALSHNWEVLLSELQYNDTFSISRQELNQRIRKKCAPDMEKMLHLPKKNLHLSGVPVRSETLLDAGKKLAAQTKTWAKLLFVEEGDESLRSYLIWDEQPHSTSFEEVNSWIAQNWPSFILPQHVTQPNKHLNIESGSVLKRGEAKWLETIQGIQIAIPSVDIDSDGTESKLTALWKETLHQSEVDRRDDFFALGGNSLQLAQLVYRIQQEIASDFSVEDAFTFTRLCDQATHILQRGLEAQTDVPLKAEMTAQSVTTYPTSPQQRRLWFSQSVLPNPSVYNIPVVWDTNEEIHFPLLRNALWELVNRQQALRTIFELLENEPVQKVLSTPDVDSLPIQNHVAETLSEFEAKTQDLLNTHFDLTQFPLFKLHVIQMQDRTRLVLLMHHIISDQRSIEIFFDELTQLYEGLKKGETPRLTPLKEQVGSLSEEVIKGKRNKNAAHLDFWISRLGTEIPRFELPSPKKRPELKSYLGSEISTTFDEDIIQLLEKRRKEWGVSVFSLVYSLTGLYLFRYSGQETIIFGVPTSGRASDEANALIGFFVNILPFRLDIAPHSTVQSWINAVNRDARNMLAHQSCPLDSILDAANLMRSGDREPLFDLGLSFTKSEHADVSIPEENRHTGTSKYDLTFTYAHVTGQALRLRVEYASDLFTREWMIPFLQRFKFMVAEVLKNPHQKVGTVPILFPEEERRIKEELNATKTTYPRNAGIYDLFIDVAEANPKAIALQTADRTWTYQELSQCVGAASDQINKDYRLRKGDRVAVLLPKGADFIIALLAVLRNACIYIPLDAGAPKERLAFMLDETGSKVVITHSDLFDKLPKEWAEKAFCTDTKSWSKTLALATIKPPASDVTGDDTAYIMYTSGSTGQPKGVEILHRNIVRLVRNTNYVSLAPGDAMLLMASLAFDAATFEIWGTLLNGAKLVIPNTERLLDVRLFEEHIERFGINKLFITTALFNLFAQNKPQVFAQLQALLVGGERLIPSFIQAVRKACPSLNIFNIYGPTENCTFSLFHLVREQDQMDIPLGRPIANSSAFVVNGYGALQAPGVPGELLLGGDGLMKGYVNNDSLTRQKRIHLPFSDSPLYRSGDQAFLDEEFLIRFIGRKDDQVKIRGHRIELGEIQEALSKYPEITANLVTTRSTMSNTLELVAYYQCRNEISPQELKTRLKEHLPGYMIPSIFVQVQEFPLNKNGKIDKKKLPNPSSIPDQKASNSWDNGLQKQIAEIWEQTLQRPVTPKDQNFYELGGDSIQAIQIVSKLASQDLPISVRDLFKNPSISKLALLLEKKAPGKAQPHATIEESFELLPVQHWFFDQFNSFRYRFNQSLALRLEQRADVDALQKALGLLVDHHQSLRMCYDAKNRQGSIQSKLQNPTFHVHDLEHIPDYEHVQNQLLESHQASLNPCKGEVFRGVLCRTPQEDVLVLIAHHLAIDGVSWRIILDDLAHGYLSYKDSKKPTLPPVTTSLKDVSDYLTQSSHVPQERLSYWEKCASEDSFNSLPDNWFTHSSSLNSRGTFGQSLTQSIKLDAATTQSLENQTDSSHSIQTILLSALSSAWAQLTGRSRIAVIMESHGRADIDLDLSRTVGWMTALFPVYFPCLKSLSENIPVVNKVLREQSEHPEWFGLHYWMRKNPAPHLPLISFNYLGKMSNSRGDLWQTAKVFTGTEIHPHLNRFSLVDITAINLDGTLHLSASFASGILRESAISAFLKRSEELLQNYVQDSGSSGNANGVMLHAASSFPSIETPKDDKPTRQNEKPATFSLSPLQKGLLYEYLKQADSQSYHVQIHWKISGSFNADYFASAWQFVAQKHGALRLGFIFDDVELPLQEVRSDRMPRFRRYDFSALSDAVSSQSIDRLKHYDLDHGFDLSSDSLHRFYIIKTGQEKWEVLWSHHHITCDGWSLNQLQADFVEAYQRISRGENLPIQTLKRDYSDYIGWLEKQDQKEARKFWASFLADFDGATRILPFNGLAKEAKTWSERHFKFDNELTSQIRDLAAQMQTTPAVLMQTLWALTLHTFTGDEQISMGTVLSGRPASLSGAESIVGLFINTVPFLLNIDSDSRFDDLLKTAHEKMLDLNEFGYLSVNQIQEASGVDEALFETMFVFENYPNSELESGALPFELNILDHHDRQHYDLGVAFTLREQLSLTISFNPRLYPEWFIDQLHKTLTHLTRSVLSHPQVALHVISWLDETEKSALVRRSMGKEVYPPEKDFLQQIAEHLRDNPETTVLKYGNQSINRKELLHMASRVDAYLAQHKFGKGDRIGVSMYRGPELIAVLVGILWRGCSFVPIVPQLPKKRAQELRQQANVKKVITPDLFNTLNSNEADIRAPQKIHSQDEAYVLFTSGSTGKPKGCSVTRGNMENFLLCARDLFKEHISQPIAVPFMASYAFDFNIAGIFLALMDGGWIEIYEETPEIHQHIRHIFTESKVNAPRLTPSHVSILNQFEDIRTTQISFVEMGGEAVKPEHIKRLRLLNPKMNILNGYGPTETTMGCSYEQLNEPENITIGLPIDNTQLYVADKQKRLLPDGAIGELIIAGAGVTNGYLDENMTKASFITIDYRGHAERAYTSGDAARRLLDNRFVCLGRLDHQLKIRGHRIEPEEIEQVISNHDLVKTCVVFASSENKLIAAVLPKNEVIEKKVFVANLVTHIKKSLPEFMVPEIMELVDEIPITTNGKIDRRHLIKSLGEQHHESSDQIQSQNAEGDSNPLLESLITIFSEVLGKKAHAETHFFSSGGHSLKSVQVVSRVSKQLNRKLSIQQLIENPTPRALSGCLMEQQEQKHHDIPKAELTKEYPLSNAQERLWLLHNLRGEKAYNMPLALLFSTKINIEDLKAALASLAERHDILRTSYHLKEGTPVQRIHEDVAIPFVCQSLDFNALENDEALQEVINRAIESPFDLEKAPPLRGYLYEMADESQLLVLVLHHIAGDGWSMNIFRDELEQLYFQNQSGQHKKLPDLPIQYKDYAVWQRNQDLEIAEQYWLKILENVPRSIDLPLDFSAPEERSFKGGLVSLPIENALCKKLRTLASEKKISLSTCLFTSFNVLLYKYSNQAQFCMGLSIANRNHYQLENLIGFFVNLLPIPIKMDEETDMNTLLVDMDKKINQALDYQYYPIDRLVQKLCPDREANRQPLFNVAFGFQNYLDLNLVSRQNMEWMSKPSNSEGIDARAIPLNYRSSKFDLTLFVSDLKDRLSLDLEFDTEIFTRSTVERMLQNYIHFLTMIAES